MQRDFDYGPYSQASSTAKRLTLWQAVASSRAEVYVGVGVAVVCASYVLEVINGAATIQSVMRGVGAFFGLRGLFAPVRTETRSAIPRTTGVKLHNKEPIWQWTVCLVAAFALFLFDVPSVIFHSTSSASDTPAESSKRPAAKSSAAGATPACEGNTPDEQARYSQVAVGAGDLTTALRCTQAVISEWSALADEQQAAFRQAGGCPVGRNAAGATRCRELNAVATAWFVRGEALSGLGNPKEAALAYKTVADRYACGVIVKPPGKPNRIRSAH